VNLKQLCHFNIGSQKLCDGPSDLTLYSLLKLSKNEDNKLAFSRLSSAITTTTENSHFPFIQWAAIESAKSQQFLKAHEVVPLISAALSLCTIGHQNAGSYGECFNDSFYTIVIKNFKENNLFCDS